jgi:hypothetical protein
MTFSLCGSGGTGRRAGLRIPWPKGREGSNPFFRTTGIETRTLGALTVESRSRVWPTPSDAALEAAALRLNLRACRSSSRRRRPPSAALATIRTLKTKGAAPALGRPDRAGLSGTGTLPLRFCSPCGGGMPLRTGCLTELAARHWCPLRDRSSLLPKAYRQSACATKGPPTLLHPNSGAPRRLS